MKNEPKTSITFSVYGVNRTMKKDDQEYAGYFITLIAEAREVVSKIRFSVGDAKLKAMLEAVYPLGDEYMQLSDAMQVSVTVNEMRGFDGDKGTFVYICAGDVNDILYMNVSGFHWHRVALVQTPTNRK